MKKNLFFLTLLFVTLLPVFSLDFGFKIDNNTKLIFPGVNETNKPFLDQRNSATAWIRHPFNNDGSFYFASEAYFQFKYLNGNPSDLEEGASKQFLIDLTLLKLGYSIRIDNTKTLNFSLGRFAVSDISSLVFNQASDGIMMNLNSRRFEFHFYAGYTGFLNSLNVKMLRHQDSTYGREKDEWYDFATPYVVVDTSLTFPYFFLNQTFTAELVMAAGTTGLNYGGNNGGNAGISRFYLTAALNGPLASRLFYVLTSTFEFEKYGVANLSRFILSFYPNFLSSAISLSGVYASGDNGALAHFQGITSKTAVHSLVAKEHTGLLKAGVSGSIKPLQVIYISGGVDFVWSCPEKLVSFDGFEWNATLGWQPFSDLNISAIATHFIGHPAYERAQDKFELTLRASLSF